MRVIENYSGGKVGTLGNDDHVIASLSGVSPWDRQSDCNIDSKERDGEN